MHMHNVLCERANDDRVRPFFSMTIIPQTLDSIKESREYIL